MAESSLLERAASVLSYNPSTGEFSWKQKPHPKCRVTVGSKAGCVSRGYLAIRIDGRTYHAHRLAWLLTHGEMPVHQIDHANRNRMDNRISNLRQATNQQNQFNRSLAVNNNSGCTGVHFHKKSGKWQARVKHMKKTISLGLYSKLEDAIAARVSGQRKYYGQFAAEVSHV